MKPPLRIPSRRRWFVQAVLGLLTLPLSAAPIWLYTTHTADGRLMWLNAQYQFLPPGTPQLSAVDQAIAHRDRRTVVDGVPVLVYHGIGQATDTFDRRYVVSRDHFAQQMRALAAAGYHAITVDRLAQYLHTGATTGLPSKPILITFNDGQTADMLQADPILAATHMRAAMFVDTGEASSGSYYYEQWDSLSSYASSGRWQLENHTNDLRSVDRHGTRLISRLVDPQPGQSLTTYRRSVAADLDSAERLLEQHGAGRAVAFAYPFGDWGQHAQAGVARALRAVLARRFELAFDQDGQSGWRPAMPGDDPLHIHRLEVMDWTGVQLLARLDAAARIGNAVYAERGLDHSYRTIRLLNAAKAYTCRRPPGVVLRGRPGDPAKRIALSFDDGPSVYTPQILDLLEHAHAHATFFVSGDLLPGRQRILSRMLADGDEIGNGTASTVSLTRWSPASILQSIRQTAGAISRSVPVAPCLVRPPFGAEAWQVARVAARLNERVALWSVDPRDFASTDPAVIARRVLSAAHPGAIVVLHDGGSSRWATVQAIPRILAGLDLRGYRVTTITDLYRPQRAYVASATG